MNDLTNDNAAATGSNAMALGRPASSVVLPLRTSAMTLQTSTSKTMSGADVLDLTFLKNPQTYRFRTALLRRVHRRLTDPPNWRGSYKSRISRILRSAMQALYQLCPDELRPPDYLPETIHTLHGRCVIIAAMIPATFFDQSRDTGSRLLEGVAKFLQSARDDPASLPQPQSSSTSGVFQEKMEHPVTSAIDYEVVSIDSESCSSSEEDTSGSASSDDDVSPETKEDVASPSSGPKPKKKKPANDVRQDDSDFDEVFSSPTKHSKKRKRAHGTERAGKRIAIEPSQSEERHIPNEPAIIEPIPARPGSKKRNPDKIVIQQLEGEIHFLKEMFLYGIGIAEGDLRAYRVRVQEMKYSHRQAWDTMTGKKNEEHAARGASGAGATGMRPA